MGIPEDFGNAFCTFREGKCKENGVKMASREEKCGFILGGMV